MIAWWRMNTLIPTLFPWENCLFILIIPHPALASHTGWWAWPGPHCGPYGKPQGPFFKLSRAFLKCSSCCVPGLPPRPECAVRVRGEEDVAQWLCGFTIWYVHSIKQRESTSAGLPSVFYRKHVGFYSCPAVYLNDKKKHKSYQTGC